MENNPYSTVIAIQSMPCYCFNDYRPCCTCKKPEQVEEDKVKEKIKGIVLEYLYGSEQEKPRKKIHRYKYKKVPVLLNRNGQVRRNIAKKRIEILEKRNRRFQRDALRSKAAVPTQTPFRRVSTQKSYLLAYQYPPVHPMARYQIYYYVDSGRYNNSTILSFNNKM